MTPKQIWVIPSGKKWEIKKAGVKRAANVLNSKAEAVKKAKKIAKKNKAEMIVKNKDGSIGWRNSYGRDPFPPKG